MQNQYDIGKKMFRYFKEKRKVKLDCPQCKKTITFQIPDSVFEKEHAHFPFTFRYIHGHPPHSITLYIDKEDNIRGKEFGDSIQLSNDIIDKMFETRNLHSKSKEESGKIMQTVFNTFTTVIDAHIPEAETIHFAVGQTLGKNFENMFISKEEGALMEELTEFWKQNGFGHIDELKFGTDTITFNVYECFECSHLPVLGHPVCKLDEGFLTTLFESKFQKLYEVKELECFATGKDYCKFQVKELGRKVA
ncbi:MAG: V4R domain-containing protein [Promethearchaeota archaeon]